MKYIFGIVIKLVLMIIIGLSAIGFVTIGLWALIPWTICWIFYDINQEYNREEENGNDNKFR